MVQSGEKVKIEFLVLGPDVPSTRFRVMQYLPLLAEKRVKFKVFAMEPSFCPPGLKKMCRFWHYLRALCAARCCDLVFMQKPGFIINRPIYLKWLFRLQKNVVFDFDDAIFLDHETGSAQDERWLERLAFILSHSRMVIAGNPYLGEFARKFNPRVEIIPTPIDCERYRPLAQRSSGKPLIIGWMGTDSNLPYLADLIPVMRRLLAEADIRFMIVSGPDKKPPAFDFNERVVWKEWCAKTEIDDLRLFDIGLMPLANNDYTQGKCSFKLLQYMAVGIPLVASPVGMNRQIVEAGINGFLAHDEKEWLDKLRLLCRDDELRQRMGSAGRQMIEASFSLQKISQQWTALLQRVAADKNIRS